MATEQFITEHLDLWATAIKYGSTAGRGPSGKVDLYGIKKLRELILELAVRGLLVPQDPKDEPASELLKKIAAEKAKLVKEGRIGKEKPLPPISTEEMPFDLPNSWCWVRLGEVTNYGFGDKAEPEDANETTWVLELEDVEKETSKLLRKVRFVEREFKSSKNIFKTGDVIYGKLRPYLDKVLVADEDGVCTTEMIPVRAHAVITPAFLRLSMKSPRFIAYANSATHGMNLPRVGTDKARLALIPLCSETTQHRIVAKVDELMALCDQLEQQTDASLNAHQTLVKTLLNALTSAAEHAQFASSWQRIAEHFDTLFTTEESIDQLKQTILQLAVMGKLVPQDPKDEPAVVLLKKIATEKAKLVKEGKIRNAKPLSAVDASEMAFSLPRGWAYCRLQDLVSTLGDGLHGTPTYDDDGDYHFINGNNLNDGKILIKPDTKRVGHKEYEKHRKDLNSRTVLLSINGTIGNVAFFNGEQVILGKSACYFNLLSGVQKLFVKRFIESPLFFRYAASQATGSTISNLGLKAMNAFPIPLPPTLEQERITQKIDELFALCDQLKSRLSDAQTTQVNLADALTDASLAEA